MLIRNSKYSSTRTHKRNERESFFLILRLQYNVKFKRTFFFSSAVFSCRKINRTLSHHDNIPDVLKGNKRFSDGISMNSSCYLNRVDSVITIYIDSFYIHHQWNIDILFSRRWWYAEKKLTDSLKHLFQMQHMLVTHRYQNYEKYLNLDKFTRNLCN